MTIISLKTRLCLSAALIVMATAAGPALAQNAQPDAGQTLRDIERERDLLPRREAAPVIIDQRNIQGAATDSTVQIPVSTIRVTGQTLFDEKTLHNLIDEYEGGTHTLADLDQVAARITAYYREKGYMVARAYIPPQRVENGVITIQVLEGNVDSVTLQNESSLSDARTMRYVDAQVSRGDVLDSAPVDRSLLLLADTPGVGNARATLRPGASVGTSELIVSMDRENTVDGYLSADNHGNRYTGEYRLDGGLTVNSPLGIGDQLTLRALGSNEDLAYGRVAYSLPVGYDGLRVGASYASSWYGLGEEFSSLDAKGRAEISSLFATYPLIRSLSGNVFTSLSLEDKRLKDRTKTPYSASDRAIQLATAGVSGNHYDNIFGGGITSFDFSLTGGHLSMDADSRSIDDTTARAAGNYLRMTYNLSRLQRITDNNSFYATIWGQQANKNLNSSEKMSLGGANGVRAYPQGEGDGDEGWVGTAELRHDLPANKVTPFLQASVFYDVGSVQINHTDYNPDKNTRTISGAGVGLSGTIIGGIDFKTSVAWRTSGGDPKSDSDDRVPRVWFQLSKQF